MIASLVSTDWDRINLVILLKQRDTTRRVLIPGRESRDRRSTEEHCPKREGAEEIMSIGQHS